MFSDTPGMNAAATVLLAFLRPSLLRLFTPRDNQDNLVPSFKSMGITPFLKYTTASVFIHSLALLSIEFFSFSGIWLLLLRVAFKAVETAKQGKETSINNANKYRNEKLPIAEADADQILQEAEATKQERINDANAQVAMFNAKFEEYEKNPEVTKKRMFYEAMEGILPQLRVIIDGTDSTTTMLHEQLNSVSEQNVQSSASPADSSSTSK